MHIGVVGNLSGIANTTTQSKSIALTNAELAESKHQPQSNLLVSTAIISGAVWIKGDASTATEFDKTAEKYAVFAKKLVEEIRIVITFKFLIAVTCNCYSLILLLLHNKECTIKNSWIFFQYIFIYKICMKFISYVYSVLITQTLNNYPNVVFLHFRWRIACLPPFDQLKLLPREKTWAEILHSLEDVWI